MDISYRLNNSEIEKLKKYKNPNNIISFVVIIPRVYFCVLYCFQI